MTINREDLERLEEIRQEIMNLTNEAADIVRRADRTEYERARAYWIGHVHCAMGGEENQYVSAGHDSLYDTIQGLGEDVESMESDDDPVDIEGE